METGNVQILFLSSAGFPLNSKRQKSFFKIFGILNGTRFFPIKAWFLEVACTIWTEAVVNVEK